MRISRNDYFRPLKIIIRRPGKVTLKNWLNDQTISPNIVLEENFLHSYPTFSITNNFFDRLAITCRAWQIQYCLKYVANGCPVPFSLLWT